jgi:MFS transporter, SP family, sugar:H+ symporter
VVVEEGKLSSHSISFAVNFSIPYLLYAPYANLGSKAGFVFGVIAVCCLVFTYLCVPEFKGRSLERVHYMFRAGVPLRKFGVYEGSENPDRDEWVGE